MKSLKDLVDEHHKIALMRYEDKKGEEGPLLVAYSKGERHLLSLQWGSDEEKEAVLTLVSIFFLAKGVESYTVSFEGWCLSTDMSDAAKADLEKATKGLMKISESEHAIECLNIGGVVRNESTLVSYKINKDKTLGECTMKDGAFNGIFTRLLPPDNTPTIVRESAKMYMETFSEFFDRILL